MNDKTVLRSAGCYQELGYENHPFALRLADSRGRRPQEHKSEVVDYLRSGRTMAFTMGDARDCFDRTKTVSLSTVTDGVFQWRKGLAHYVEHYGVLLSPVFEAHIRANNWCMPENIDTSRLALAPFVAPTPDDLADAAALLVADGRTAEAEAAYRRVLDVLPQHQRSLRSLAAACHQQRRYRDAIGFLDRVIASDSKDSWGWFQRGVAGGELAKINGSQRSDADVLATAEAAVSDLRRALELGHPHAAQALENLGDGELRDATS